MGATDWPIWWGVLAPVLMFGFMGVCMLSMHCVMPAMHGRRDPTSARERSSDADPERTGAPVAARFPDGQPAFEAYRVETLRRLDEEQTESSDFIDRLRGAKDKAEFDRFMTDYRARPDPPA